MEARRGQLCDLTQNCCLVIKGRTNFVACAIFQSGHDPIETFIFFAGTLACTYLIFDALNVSNEVEGLPGRRSYLTN